MKTLLLLLLTCLPLWAATTYTVLSDNTNRTITGGTTNLGFLNANQTFTGTNRFSSVVIATNTANTFAGNGAGLTNMGQFRFRILFRTNNLYTASITSDGGTVGTFTATNYVGGSTSTNIMNLTLPALMSTNSKVGVMVIGERTNAIHSNVYMDFVVGSNLCFAAGIVSQNLTPRNYMGYANSFGIEIFRNYGSFTTQLIQVPTPALTAYQTEFYIPASYIDTTTNWNLSIGLMPNTTSIPVTNIFIREFLLVEQWIVD